MPVSEITPIVNAVAERSKTAVEFAQEALAKLKQADEKFHVVISYTEERALERAKAIDEAITAGSQPGRLAGVPFVAKDNFLTFGADTTAASNILKGFEAPYQATAIEKLEAEGAVCIAKVNLDAFAHGGSTENSDFGPTKNPHDDSRVPGGSSGGSAAAVALGAVPFAVGTDTGGSIRQPASFCGVVGLKPTYGLVSRYGVVAMASSTDVIGPLTRNAYDAGLILDIMAGNDPRDGTTLKSRDDNYVPAQNPTEPKRVGVIKEYMSDSVSPDVKASVEQALDNLRSIGHTVEEVSLPSLPLGLAVYYIVVPAELSSNLARYDGIKYGLTATDAESLDDVYGQTRDRGFNAENKRRIMIGNYVLSSGYYDAYYRKAQTVRTMLINDFNDAFKNYDLLVGPVAPTTAFRLGENTADPLMMYMSDIMTVAASLAGLPAISVPAEASKESGLPVGLQIIGRQMDDGSVLKLAAAFEASKRSV